MILLLQFCIMYQLPALLLVKMCGGVIMSMLLTIVITQFRSNVIQPRKNSSCVHDYTLHREWSVTDACGNEAKAESFIRVIDHQKPEWGGFQPSFHYVEPTINVGNIDVLIPIPRAYDNCDSLVIAQCTTTKEIGCTDDDYTLTRICTVQDDCGNMGYPVTQVVEVEDREPCPFTTTPDHITVECDEDLGEQYTAPTHECEYMVMSESLIGGSCEDSAVIVKTWTITDECGNTRSTQQSISVEDTQAPDMTYLADVEYECEEVLTSYVSVTDNCDPAPTQLYKEVQVYHSAAHDYKLLQQWYIKDRCGNNKYYERAVTVKDTVDPTVGVVPEDITVDHLTIPGYPDYVNCDDNCPTHYVSQTFEETKVDGTCDEEFFLKRKWCCIDSTGNSACKEQLITVEDNEKPQFYNCPADYTQMSGNPIPFPNLFAGDGYGSNATVTKSQESSYSGYAYSLIITRTWIAEDNCENKETCIQSIFLTEPPPILCVPDNMTLDCTDIGLIPTVSVVTQEIDDCSGDGMEITFVSETKLPGDCEWEYCLVRTWHALDNLKGSIQHAAEYDTSQTICVHDRHAPHWDFEAYRTVDCSKAQYLPNYLDIHPIRAVDDCGGATVTTCCWAATDAYGYHRDYTATDDCGNSVTERMQVVVVDMEDPVLSDRPDSLTVECEAPPGPGHNGIPPITCTDNCGTPTLTSWQFVLEQQCAHRLTLVRGWRCEDNKGNMVSHEQTVTVTDNHPPEWDGDMPEHTTLECDQELPSVPEVKATDNCVYVGYVQYLGETHHQQDVVTYATEILTIIRTWAVYDDCGQSIDWQQSIQIYDTEYPTLIGVPENEEAYECDACLCASVTAVDNCGAPSMHSWNVTETGSCPTEKTIITYWEAVDDVGHSVHDSHTLVIRDSNPPVFIGVAYADLEVDCDSVPPAPVGVTAQDDCDPHVTVVYKEELIKSAYWIQAELFAMMQGKEDNAGHVEYDLYRTWSATDSCGHSIEKRQTIYVNDRSPPVIAYKPGHATYDCYDVPSALHVDVEATDNCDNYLYKTFDEHTVKGTCPGEYKLIRTWTARDNKDNLAEHIQTITVEDNNAPQFTYVPQKKVYIECENWPIPVPREVGATDDCGDVSMQYNQYDTPGTCDQEGRYLRKWEATDECGNTRVFEQNIIVIDTGKPFCVNCPDAYKTIDCAEAVVAPDFTAQDLCGDVTVNPDVSTYHGSCVGEKLYVYSWTAEDECGNLLHTIASINTLDTTAPDFLTLPPETTYDCNIPADGIVNYIDQVTYEDLCSEVGFTHSYQTVPGTCDFEFYYQFTFTISDSCGNTAVETRSIHIVDTEPPTFTNVPVSKEVPCENAEQDYNVIAVDNCEGVFGYAQPDRNIIDGTCEDETLISYTWSATDQCGHTASLAITVTFKDTEAPELTLSSHGGDYPCDNIPSLPTLKVTDNCDENPVIHYHFEGEGSYDVTTYTVVHYWQACDKCGNCNDVTATFNIYDNEGPVISAVNDITVTCKDVPPVPAITCHDNCDPHVELDYTETTDHGTCTDEYVIHRKWECRDNDGSLAVAEYYITVFDNVSPVWAEAAPKDITYECDEEVVHPVVTANDDCTYITDVEESCTWSGDKCENVTTCQWVTQDDCGNRITQTWSFTVVDTTSPELSEYPEDVTIACSSIAAYEGNTQYWPGVITASDNCEYGVDVKFHLTRKDGTCEHDYTMILSWTAIDDCGNDKGHHMSVYVHDRVAPQFLVVPNDVEIGAYTTYPTIASAIHDAVAKDDCDANVLITAIEEKHGRQYNRECDNEFVIVRVFTATDECGIKFNIQRLFRL
eukprot:TRINITY_DN21_c0_g1_i3.p1 TRINITY_DN21_c0_g1~~TRINITY_DN21_c0_g1_i3.p1  ORF type:complete len:1807 (-),score=563.74 TRINITY_DN21_c0_g1_i3:1390-6810(-)